MKEISFEVTSRQKTGKGVARKLRAAGTIPGVIYGKGESPVPIEINYNQFVTTMRKAGGENLLINLSVDGQESQKKALLREVQRDPINGKPLHLDFQHISLTEKIHIQVPIVLEGTPEGVKNLGGIMSWVVRHVEVSCLPTDIPEKIMVDVSALKLHESIHVKDLNIVGAEIVSDPDETIVTVVPPTVTKEETPVPAEGEAAAAAVVTPEGEEPTEPEVISEKKAEERRAEKEKAEKKPEKGEKKKE